MNDIKNQMEKIYTEKTLEEIPWNLENPPQLLIDLVESGWIEPCEAIDLGCGAGNYSVWLASKGFNVTGIDISQKAIDIAMAKASQKNINCRFIAVDLLTGMSEMKDFKKSFDFAFDWEVLHHIFPEYRKKYIQNVSQTLKVGGKYLSVCFSEKNKSFDRQGKYFKTPIGTELYFSSEEEIYDLFKEMFIVDDISTIEIMGKYGPHQVVAVKSKLK
jgi:2-polyprenyl-3-methyl-5-hydroxy-6-metoxy-1,4-benzoquinol methylase